MTRKEEIESVDIVDSLMMYFRNNSQPVDGLITKAYEHGIDVQLLKEYVEEVENA